MKHKLLFFSFNLILKTSILIGFGENEIKQAENLFNEEFYEEALPIYLNLLESEHQKIILPRVASCYFEVGNLDAVINTLNQCENTDCTLYLKSMTEKKQGLFKEALLTLEELLKQSLPIEKKNLITLQQGLILELLENSEEAKKMLKGVKYLKEAPLLFTIAQIHLATLLLKELQFTFVYETLNNASKALPNNHPLQNQILLIKGIALVAEEREMEGIDSFKHILDSPYHTAALNEIVNAYLQSLSKATSLEQSKKIIKQGTPYIDSLNQINPSIPLIGEFFLLKAERLRDEISFNEADCFFKNKQTDLLTLIRLTHLQPSDEKRNASYHEMLNSSSLPPHLEALLLLYLGSASQSHAETESTLLRAILLSRESAPELFIPSIKMLALKQALANQPENGWKTLQQAMNHPKKDEQIDFLNGLLLIENNQLQEGTKALELFLTNYPNSPFIVDTLVALAKCAEREKLINLKQKYLKQLYENYPNSPRAAEAYFCYYSYRDYMQGDTSAFKHLKKMTTRFPNSPFISTAYYFIGLNALKDRVIEKKGLKRRDFIAAIDAFQQAETTAEAMIKNKQLKKSEEKELLHLKFLARLERGKAILMIAKESNGGKRQIFLNYAKELLEKPIEDPEISPEFALSLARVFIEQEQEEEGLLALERGIMESKNNSLLYELWIEKGAVYYSQEKFREALKAFEAAGNIPTITPNQKLTAWIQESLCLQQLKDYKQAMQKLSHVINDTVVSPKRIDAMFLRADLYQLQGQKELARKQWEAIVKKGGERANEAKEKLRIAL